MGYFEKRRPVEADAAVKDADTAAEEVQAAPKPAAKVEQKQQKQQPAQKSGTDATASVAVDDNEHEVDQPSGGGNEEVADSGIRARRLARQRRDLVGPGALESPGPCCVPADAAALAENARLMRELLEARHRLANREEKRRQEAESWRSEVLRLRLSLATSQSAEAARSSNQESVEDAVKRLKKDLEERRRRREEYDAQLRELDEANRRVQEELSSEAALSGQLHEQACRQAVAFLTRRSSTAPETFISSLPRLDAETMKWVKAQIETHLRQRDLGLAMAGLTPPSTRTGSNAGGSESTGTTADVSRAASSSVIVSASIGGAGTTISSGSTASKGGTGARNGVGACGKGGDGKGATSSRRGRGRR